MSTPEEPKHAVTPRDADFESTDAGWDPYVTSLMLGAAGEKFTAGGDEDDGVPVMSFSSTQAKRGR